jgi:hypothetical protein
MDEETGARNDRRLQSTAAYEKLSLIDSRVNDDDDRDDNDDRNQRKLIPIVAGLVTKPSSFNDDDNDDDDGDFDSSMNNDPLKSPRTMRTTTTSKTTTSSSNIDINNSPNTISTLLHKNLIKDYDGISYHGYQILDGQFTIKLLKFIVTTFLGITLTHVIVRQFFDDRDKSLRLWHIWVFEGDLIVRDAVVFFIVGRLWQQRGIDHLAWIGTTILCNVYFEMQNVVPFLQHSVTLYQMHCIWPWQLWLFVLILIPSIGALVGAHIVRAWNLRVLFMKLMELALCIFFFVAPLAPSSYFHLHHWYAGWLLGMHANFDVWWSRFAMAWCWGMYINGIAVYGRDPVLTCEYAYFLTIDNHCPYVNCYLKALEEMKKHPQNHTDVVEMVPADWRNCSSEGFHP